MGVLLLLVHLLKIDCLKDVYKRQVLNSMLTMKNIAVIAGGNSSEYEVSIKSGNYVYDQVDETRYNKYLVIIKGRDWHVQMGDRTYPVDKNDFSFTKEGEKIVFDFAYITIRCV